jgi:hypothetical protein
MLTGFWRSWMWAWCAATMGLGVMFLGAAWPETSFPARLYYMLAGREGGLEAQFSSEMAFTLGVLGAVLIGWGTTIIAMIRETKGGGAHWVWRGLTIALAAWFIPDTIISIATGFALNAIPNTVFVTTFLIPVLACGLLKERAA